MTPRTFIGWFLIAFPFVAIFVLLLRKYGWTPEMSNFAFSVVGATCVGTGWYLVMGRSAK